RATPGSARISSPNSVFRASSCDVLRRREPEHERLGEAARIAAERDAPCVDTGGVEAVDTIDARTRVDAHAAERVRDGGGDVHRDASGPRPTEPPAATSDD